MTKSLPSFWKLKTSGKENYKGVLVQEVEDREVEDREVEDLAVEEDLDATEAARVARIVARGGEDLQVEATVEAVDLREEAVHLLEEEGVEGLEEDLQVDLQVVLHLLLHLILCPVRSPRQSLREEVTVEEGAEEETEMVLLKTVCPVMVTGRKGKKLRRLSWHQCPPFRDSGHGNLP